MTALLESSKQLGDDVLGLLPELLGFRDGATASIHDAMRDVVAKTM
jgi:hypothetical protein